MFDHQKRERGFTLIEVMIVVVIIGVLATVGVPSFSNWRDNQGVKSAAQALYAHLKQARVKAVAENRSVSVTFSSTGYTYDADVSGTCGRCAPESVDLTQFSGKVSLSPTTTRTFTSRGTCNSGTITLTVGDYSKSISLNVIGRAYM